MQGGGARSERGGGARTQLRRLAMVTLVVVVAATAAPGTPASARRVSEVARGDDPVAAAEAALENASAARAAAEARLADARARQAAITAELEELADGAARITEDLARARAEVREYAVAAYIDGGASALATTGLDTTDRTEIAWHSHLVGATTADAAEAVDRFNALRDANEPERVAASARLDRVNEEVEAAFNDAVQAGAHERDAEAAVADARAAAAAAAAQAAALQRAAAEESRKAAAARARSDRSEQSAPEQSRPDRPSGSAAPVRQPADPAPGGGATSREAALLAKIRHCESRGNYAVVSASGRYRGAYQFDRRTWAGVGGSGDPAAASPAEQDQRALMLLRKRGTRPWPNCG